MAPLSILHRVMHSGAQLHPDQRCGVLNSTQSNTRDPSLRSFLVTGNPSGGKGKVEPHISVGFYLNFVQS